MQLLRLRLLLLVLLLVLLLLFVLLLLILDEVLLWLEWCWWPRTAEQDFLAWRVR